MTSKKLKQAENEEKAQDSDESSEEESDSDEPAGENEEIQVDFEGRNPSVGDFDGVKQLLYQLFRKAHINLTELSNLIISQDYLGSVMKQAWDEEMDDDDDDADDESNVVFGITTAINMTSRKDTECVQQIKNILLAKAEKNATDNVLKLLRDILTNDAQTVGFILNERYINIPAQISVPMLENLCKEIKRAVEKKKTYNFSYYVMLLKFYRKDEKEGKPSEDIFSNPEEELFLRESLASFEYSIKDESDSGLSGKWKEDDEEMTPFRKLVILDGKRFPEIVESVSGFIAGNN